MLNRIALMAAASLGISAAAFSAREHHMGRTRYPRGYKPAKYSFVSTLTGKRLPSTSKYMPHQGKAEIARRLARG